MTHGERPPRWYHEENGFAVLEDLLEAHGGMAYAAGPLLAGGSARVIDLGCGNGALLARLCEEHPGTVPFGVDRDPRKIERARGILPRHRANFVASCAFDVARWWRAGWTFDVMLLCPGRFLEVAAPRSDALRRRIAERVDRLLLYAYSDWISTYGGLEAIARLAGLDVARASGVPRSSTRTATPNSGRMVQIALPRTYRASAIQCAIYREDR
jgi:SAM-dependent methyltransferase